MWLDDDDRMGWDGMEWNGVYRHRHRHHIIVIYVKHDTINNQPTKPTKPKKHDANNNNNNNILQIHFYDDTPSFEKDNVFFLGGWRKERERRENYIM